MTAYYPYLFLALGLVAIAIAFLYTSNKKTLKQNGILAEGIIFKQEESNNYNRRSDDNIQVKDKITVRFVTKKQEWITEEVKQDILLFYTGQYKDGETVKIYYDEKNPSNFYVDTKQSELLGRVIIAIVGIGLVLYALYNLYSSNP